MDSTSNKMEQWISVPGYEGLYEASDSGLIRSIRAGKIMSPFKTNKGYMMVSLSMRGSIRKFLVHRLIKEAFDGASDLPVDHIDKDRTNNALTNLRYLTVLENNKRSCDKAVDQLTRAGQLISTFESITQAYRSTGIHWTNISSCCLGNRQSAGGYEWRFAEPVSVSRNHIHRRVSVERL